MPRTKQAALPRLHRSDEGVRPPQQKWPLPTPGRDRISPEAALPYRVLQHRHAQYNELQRRNIRPVPHHQRSQAGLCARPNPLRDLFLDARCLRSNVQTRQEGVVQQQPDSEHQDAWLLFTLLY